MSTSRLSTMVICAAIFKIAHLPLSMSIPFPSVERPSPGQSVVPVVAGQRGFQGITGLYWAAVLASKRVRPCVLKFAWASAPERGVIDNDAPNPEEAVEMTVLQQ